MSGKKSKSAAAKADLRPVYPIYVISKGRSDQCLTAKFLIKDGVDFRLVVEPQEADLYAAEFGLERLLITPFSNLGLGSIPARNFVWEHAKAAGAKRHWILDDNICLIYRRYGGKRIPADSGPAFRMCEVFTDRYTNIGIAGMNYVMFLPDTDPAPPFRINVHLYSCLLIDNALPNRWRGRYNEDTDLCLQVLADGLCTVQFNIYTIQKVGTMQMKGGNTAELYKGDGRLKMARSLERVWPGVVSVDRRYHRPQHVVRDAWAKFDTPLIRRPDLDWDAIARTDGEAAFGMPLEEVKPLQSKRLRKLLDAQEESRKKKEERE